MERIAPAARVAVRVQRRRLVRRTFNARYSPGEGRDLGQGFVGLVDDRQIIPVAAGVAGDDPEGLTARRFGEGEISAVLGGFADGAADLFLEQVGGRFGIGAKALT